MFSKKSLSCKAVPRIVSLTVLPAAFALVCVTLLGAQAAWAQSQPAGVYSLNYFTAANGGTDQEGWGGTVRITNPGSPPVVGAAVIPPEPAAVCALIYVYRPDEQLAECCGCRVSRNGLRELDVNLHLTANPLTADPLRRGVLKLVSSFTPAGAPPANDAQCDPRTITPTRTLRAWNTHLQFTGSTPWNFTETPFLDAPLSDNERGRLEFECTFVWFLGSSRGVCNCGLPPGPS
jgi:hypothetical protein